LLLLLLLLLSECIFWYQSKMKVSMSVSIFTGKSVDHNFEITSCNANTN
jgi:hypothetical protein